MRLAFDGRAIQDHFPGIGRYAYNLARALAQLEPGLDLQLLVDPAARNQRLDLAALAALPNIHLVPAPVSHFSVRQQWRLPQLLRQLRADVYHSPYYLMPYAPGGPTVLTAYDLIPLRYPAYFSASQRLIFRLAHQLALRAAHSVLAISAATGADLRRWFGLRPERLTITPLAPDPIFQPRPAAEVSALRARLGLPEDYLLYVGSNKPHKNLPRLVQAFAPVARQFKTATLAVAGQWEARYPQARTLAEALGLGERVRWLGPAAEADLPALLSGARLFVFPSEYEGFGLPPLEAMACGAPTLCGDTPALRETGGQAARYADPASVEDWSAALARALAEPEQLPAWRAASRAQAAGFTWENTARLTLAGYAAAKAR